ncbi:MAG: SLATT domain-containing protein [Eubacterium sp.]|nr:SLATT domain-containing protein [Eubacterium sp.]
MDNERKELEDQIWFTRVSRIKAENRLIEKEHFAQFINIYYSLFAIICSILSYHYNDTKMGLFTIIITISLMISILYLNGQKYLEQARDYRTNYTQLHALEMKTKDPAENIMKIREEYCKLLNSSSNHIDYDFLKAISNASADYKEKKDWKDKKKLYYWNCLWRGSVKFLVFIFPVFLLWACEVWA